MTRLFLLICISMSAVTFTLTAEDPKLRSGPMLGAVDMREAKIWVQTTQPADVYITYSNVQTPSIKYYTQIVRTDHLTACTAILIADSVEPGTTYQYNVVIDQVEVQRPYPTTFRTQPIWKWRTDSLPSMTMAFGSCLYVNEAGYERWDKNGNAAGYGSEYEILTSITAAKPDIMVWLGDNTYLREPDWNSRSGILKRYTHTRSLPELQPLLASTANYATWDDHDYGPNDADRSFYGKGLSLYAFKLFWPNATYGVMDKPGITTSFEMLDVQVFLLDDRYYRSPNNRKDSSSANTKSNRTILGEHQVEWLIDALCSSTATFKIIAIGSQFLTDNTQKESFARVPEERQHIIDLITANNINGVLFITGDIHAAELSQLDRNATYPLYDFTSSALTAGSNKTIATQNNTYRVENTAFGEHNYGLITISGLKKQRSLTLSLCNKDGRTIFTKRILETELR